MAENDFNFEDDGRYYAELAAAFVRGKIGGADDLSPEELIGLGRARGLRLHKFKRQSELPRVRKALGVLQGLAPASLLDIGSERGAFLWPLLDSFPRLESGTAPTLAANFASIALVCARRTMRESTLFMSKPGPRRWPNRIARAIAWFSPKSSTGCSRDGSRLI